MQPSGLPASHALLAPGPPTSLNSEPLSPRPATPTGAGFAFPGHVPLVLSAVCTLPALAAKGSRRRRRVARADGASAGSKIHGVGPVADAAGYFFQPWHDRLEAQFVETLGVREVALPPHLALHSAPNGNGVVEIRTRVFEGVEGSPVRRLRLLLLSSGEKLQAFNALVYPRYECGPLPLLGVDLLSFNGHKRQLFGVDWSPLSPEADYAEERIAPYLREVRSGPFSAFAGAPSGRIYGEAPEFFSSYMFFNMPEGADALKPAGPYWEVFREYCDRYCAMLRASKPDSAAAAQLAQERQKACDRWHAERDPVFPVLRRFYGDEWVEEFTTSVLFPGSAEG
mmetsp:Transcript_50985/g.110616  ORF Transcript_50985/g.110616 Transcript_50985/m.110616 type:complete len:340 (-) Transcript_50985:210-1229(-)